MSYAFVVLNPVAGTDDPKVIRQALTRSLDDAGFTYDIYETTGEEVIGDIVRDALTETLDICIAAGGDGTVSGVADALVHTDIPLAIIPTGTGNVLARELGIPLNVEAALRLLTTEHNPKHIDMLKVSERFFILNVGIGVSAFTMRDTEREDKRRLGRIAYVWTGVKKLLGFQPWAFKVVVDGKTYQFRATEIMVTNSGVLGQPALRWEPNIRLDDGWVGVCIVRAKSALDYLRVVWDMLLDQQKQDPSLHCMRAEERISVKANHVLPVQADGEMIGQTPVEVQVVPDALAILVPANDTI